MIVRLSPGNVWNLLTLKGVRGVRLRRNLALSETRLSSWLDQGERLFRTFVWETRSLLRCVVCRSTRVVCLNRHWHKRRRRKNLARADESVQSRDSVWRPTFYPRRALDPARTFQTRHGIVHDIFCGPLQVEDIVKRCSPSGISTAEDHADTDVVCLSPSVTRWWDQKSSQR